MVHDYKLEFGPNKENNLSNHIYLGAGWGNEYDTTNANKLRASPYYFVSIDVLLANGNTVFTLADAYAYKFADQFNLAIGKSFALDAFVAYEHQNSGRPNVPISDPALNMGFGGAVRAKGIQDWFDIGLRPSFAITPWFAIVAEGTYQYIDNRAFNAIRAAAGFPNGPGSLAKFTIAPTFHYGPLDSSKIELRIYYTFATWNDNLKGSIVGGDPYRNDNMGHIIGTQAVLNF
jgi:maltoporin